MPRAALGATLLVASAASSFVFLLATDGHVAPQPWGANVFGPFRTLTERSPGEALSMASRNTTSEPGRPSSPIDSRWLALIGSTEMRQVGLNYGALWDIESWNGIGALASWRQLAVMEHAQGGRVAALVDELGADPVIVIADGALERALSEAGFALLDLADMPGLRAASRGVSPPRLLLVAEARYASAAQAIEEARAGTALSDAHVVIESDRELAGARGDPSGTLELLVRGARRYVARVSVDRPTWVVAREAYFHNWRATIDGRDVAVYPAGGFFLGVLAPEGRHVLQLEYCEPGVRIGAVIAFATAGALTWLALRTSRW